MIKINGFVLDAVLRETHVRDAAVTKYPVESGGKIADNIQPQPKGVTIEGIVSNTPLPGPVADARGEVLADGSLLHIPTDDALAMFEAVYDAREPIDIDTSLKVYTNMAMTHLEIPRDPETGEALGFTAEFEQITFKTNNRAIIQVAPPAQTGLGKKKDLGNKATNDLTKGAVVWHHRHPFNSSTDFSLGNNQVFSPGSQNGAEWQTSEVLGYNANDARTKGTTGYYHQDGTELSQEEVNQFNQDTLDWGRTHDRNGNLLPTANPLGIGGTSNTGGTAHSTEAVFQNGDGQWVDSQGDPVVYNPNYGQWIEAAPF